jgi:ubiquinone/menaquinone biosynthesis C-methylase UbiE
VPIAERLRDHYGLGAGQRVLDVGCAKGFLLHDLRRVVPGLGVAGLDVSGYALGQAMEDVRPWLVRGSAEGLPFAKGAFDLVVSINTIHNLGRPACIEALREIERVSRRHRYVQVDSWLTEEQREKFERWQLTAATYSDPDGWRRLFREAGYGGDYYWTVTE